MLRFAFRLAAHLGKLDPVGEVLAKLSRRQLVYWMAFLQLEPLPADRADARSAVLFAGLMNHVSDCMAPWHDSRLPDVQAADLLIDWGREADDKPVDFVSQSIDEAEEEALRIAALFG